VLPGKAHWVSRERAGLGGYGQPGGGYFGASGNPGYNGSSGASGQVTVTQR
jgi:hypothetical protein